MIKHLVLAPIITLAAVFVMVIVTMIIVELTERRGRAKAGEAARRPAMIRPLPLRGGKPARLFAGGRPATADGAQVGGAAD